MTEAVGAALAGERLDRAVALLWDISRARAASLVADGAVELNGRVRTDRAARLVAGDGLWVRPEALADEANSGRPRPEPEVPLEVVHEDHQVVVVDKPPGLVVHPGAARPLGTLCGGLLARYPEMAEVGEPTRPGIVHRLDIGTSGLLVAARTAVAYDSLVAQLAARTVRRGYDAFCWGSVRAQRGVVDAPVGRSGSRPTQMAVSRTGRAARTGYEVHGRYSNPEAVTRLRCRLETGRTHQIRVHLAAIGHPLLGDEVYGPDRPDAPGGLRRPALHAGSLGFRHPEAGTDMVFESAMPADMQAVRQALS